MNARTAATIVNVCWGIFAIVWIAASLTNKRSVYRETTRQRLGYWAVFAVGLFVMIQRRLPPSINPRFIPLTLTTEWIVVILCIAGLAFAFWARLTLGRNWSGTITFKEEHQLIVRGPYRIVRHPIYTAILTMLLATAILIGCLSAFLGLAFIFASFWIKLRREEKLMLQQFPDQYADYQRRVKRIVPFVV
jgi:protein-S-isoprenylcysteine O-methyltransferase Ste14